MPEIPHAAEVQITEEAQTEALKALKEDLDVANTRIRDLEQERDDLTSQLVSSKQKQLNLINEVGGIKEARPEAEDYQALKTAKDALEKKFVEVRHHFYFSIFSPICPDCTKLIGKINRSLVCNSGTYFRSSFSRKLKEK